MKQNKIVQKMHEIMGKYLDYHQRVQIVNQFFNELDVEVVDVELKYITIEKEHLTVDWIMIYKNKYGKENKADALCQIKK